MSNAGRRIVVIGGTSGIGLATAEIAAKSGADVVVSGRDADKMRAALDQLGRSVRGELFDAANRTALDAAFKRIGSFDHLVLAASGGKGAGPFASISMADLLSGFEGKFWVQWNCAQAALPYISKNGSITFIAAASARTANPATSGLAAINGALCAMVLPLARELAPIRVNAVSPGVIDTPWWNSRPKEMKEAFFSASAKSLPVGRVGTADEVGKALLALIENGFITGVILDVDGGLRAAAHA